MITATSGTNIQSRIPFRTERYLALIEVFHEQIHFHSGLSGPAMGYTWHNDAQMQRDKQETLRELWAADAIEVDTHRIFADRGHRVHITHVGYVLLCQWGYFTETD